MRQFETGATRDSDTDKYDYEGFIDPIVLEQYASYMHKHRKQADGQMRDSDNWQKGIPLDAYMKSLLRHVIDVWKNHRGNPTPESQTNNLSAVIFNAMGYMHELRKQYQRQAEETSCASGHNYTFLRL